ncbi:uncharacterized protein [Penaeus vannamei]|uniref:uncharacterized protein n=1 Tax=Penaeus vannamei TaxID=6689 RepID=UPI00387F3916
MAVAAAAGQRDHEEEHVPESPEEASDIDTPEEGPETRTGNSGTPADDAAADTAADGDEKDAPSTRFGLHGAGFHQGGLQAGFGAQPGFVGQPGFAGQPVVGGQPGFAGQPVVGAQPGFAGQPVVGGQPGFVGQPAIGGQVALGTQAGFGGQAGFPIRPPLPLPSNNCRQWCRGKYPRQFYCCEDNSKPVTIPINKPGSCPPTRPVCPRFYTPPPVGPQTCGDDSKCPGYDKCCFDICLEEHVCKPAVV